MHTEPQITLEFNNMMRGRLDAEHGITAGEIDALSARAQSAYQAIVQNRGKNELMLGWTELPYNQTEILKQIEDAAAHVRETFDTFVVLGIGGSALGPIAVQTALNHLRWNELEHRNGPKFYVEDNIDPERISSLLDVIDVKTTCFNVITKSGATAETMSQYLIISDLLKKEVGEGWQKHIIATTDAKNGNLIKIGKEEGFRLFVIPDGVGGRYSELSPVGLLPAAVCGIDIRAMLAGAAAMDKRCQSGDVWQNPALMEAVLQHIAFETYGANVQVVMPYADSLKYMADWFSQLWAESLGKNVTRTGKAVHCGQTPSKALGVTDQHSQLQLYTEGPFDKVITFLKVENYRTEFMIPHGCEEFKNVAFLGGKTLNQLIHAELKGTEFALCQAGRMNQTVILPEVSAHTIGQLLYFFEMATAYAGELLDIDAFNQPGVENSKIASFAVLGNTGEQKYVDKGKEMQEQTKPDSRYIL